MKKINYESSQSGESSNGISRTPTWRGAEPIDESKKGPGRRTRTLTMDPGYHRKGPTSEDYTRKEGPESQFGRAEIDGGFEEGMPSFGLPSSRTVDYCPKRWEGGFAQIENLRPKRSVKMDYRFVDESESIIEVNGKEYDIYDAFPSKEMADQAAEDLQTEQGRIFRDYMTEAVVVDLGEDAGRLRWGIFTRKGKPVIKKEESLRYCFKCGSLIDSGIICNSCVKK